jgi:hypothetical protein
MPKVATANTSEQECHHGNAGFKCRPVVAYIEGRLRGYVIVCAYNIAGTLGNVALIAAFGTTAALPLKAAIALSVVAVAVISVLPALSIFDDMAALRADRPKELEGTMFVATFDRSPIALYSALTIAFNAVIALVQLWALFAS